VIVEGLLSRRLLLLSGKGGVGKSTVGLALALLAHERGKRVLLVEVDAPVEAARRLGARPSGSRVEEVRPGLFTVNLDPAAVMDEYVRHSVRIEILTRRILESPAYRRFFAAAPGLPDLMVLGKIMMLEDERERWTRRPTYDLIVVDAPATGHGISFLNVPLAASRAVPVGPVGGNARRILKLLRDPQRTALAIVAIPEEMAVAEALELHRIAADDVGIEARAVFLNACHEARFSPAEEAEVLSLAARGAQGALAPGVPLAGALTAARRQIRRRRLSRFYEARLRRELALPIVRLPYLFGEPGPDALVARLRPA
jgi:anion-transporting  ArsA/GET3 family ATPase